MNTFGRSSAGLPSTRSLMAEKAPPRHQAGNAAPGREAIAFPDYVDLTLADAFLEIQIAEHEQAATSFIATRRCGRAKRFSASSRSSRGRSRRSTFDSTPRSGACGPFPPFSRRQPAFCRRLPCRGVPVQCRVRAIIALARQPAAMVGAEELPAQTIAAANVAAAEASDAFHAFSTFATALPEASQSASRASTDCSRCCFGAAIGARQSRRCWCRRRETHWRRNGRRSASGAGAAAGGTQNESQALIHRVKTISRAFRVCGRPVATRPSPIGCSRGRRRRSATCRFPNTHATRRRICTYPFYRSPAPFDRLPVHDYVVTPIDADLPEHEQRRRLRTTTARSS